MLKKIRYAYTLLKDLSINSCSRNGVVYITELADWVVKAIGVEIKRNCNIPIRLSNTSRGVRCSVLHFGAVHSFLSEVKSKGIHRSNMIIVTCFHIDDKRCDFCEYAKYFKQVDLWHTACVITKEKLLQFGIPEGKIVLVPLAIPDSMLTNEGYYSKKLLRERHGIPDDVFVIGSFQKDGEGWGDGYEPKLIKGPDIFCDVMEKIHSQLRIYVLLTGPARGYVIKRLRQSAIPYQHIYFKKMRDIVQAYKMLDVYLVASREEGGPLAILEAMACNVPVVSTKVGLAPEVIVDNYNGLLVKTEDRHGLVEAVLSVRNNKMKHSQFIERAREKVVDYVWSKIALKYEKELYQRCTQERVSCTPE